jgi:hypothetical protein
MKLGVKDRIVLLRILPAESNFRTMRTIMELRTKLLFTDEEVKAFDITMNDNIYRWDTAKATEIEVEFGDVATEVVVTALKDLDAQKKLSAEHMTLWESFVGGD